MKKLFLFLAFGCLGITAEIFFTASVALYHQWQTGVITDLTLTGQSYIWMFPIYGSIAVLFEPMYKLVCRFPAIVRMFAYAIGIFAVEFVSGWLLDMLIGKCPWEYTSRWAIMGYIRLDYIFAWMPFSYLVEKVYLFLDRLLTGISGGVAATVVAE